MGQSQIKVQKEGTVYKVYVSGSIDEDANFNHASLAGASQVEINLNDVKNINSCGIREWIKWVGTSGGAKVNYHNCPKIIVDQINMVEGFLPNSGKVMSFYVPYFNDATGDEKTVLFTYGKEYTEGKVSPPPEVKDSTGKIMEMDVIESKYFKFIKK